MSLEAQVRGESVVQPGRAIPRRLGFAALLIGVIACGGSASDVRCTALAALRDAVRRVELAEAAERSGDAAAARGHVDAIARLVAQARTGLGGRTDGHARRLLEAANYLEFIVQDFARTGGVDATLAKFAARELNRTVPGEAPLPC